MNLAEFGAPGLGTKEMGLLLSCLRDAKTVKSPFRRVLLAFFVWGLMGKLCYLLVIVKHKNNPINNNPLEALRKAVVDGSFRRVAAAWS